MNMKLDNTKREVLQEIQLELEVKGIIIGIEELAKIVEFQFIVAKLAFKKKLDIEIPIFGKFLFLQKMKMGKEKQRLAREYIKDSPEYKEELLRVQMAFKEASKERRNTKAMTLEELKEVADVFKIVNKIDDSL